MHDVRGFDVATPPAGDFSAPPISGGTLRQESDWWDYSLWRESKTVFFMPFPYRIISFFRRWAYDILVLIPLAGAGVWWITVSGGTDVPTTSVSTPDSLQAFLLSHHVSRFYPTLIAFLLCVVILRTGRTETPRRRSRPKTSLAGRMPLGVVFFLLVLAMVDLILVPGSIAERALPCVAAATWGWLIRSQVYGRVHVLEATDAGFRPSARIAFSRKSRRFAKKCLTSTWHYQQDMPAERAGIDEAVGFFARNGDARTLGWCLARAVDYNLRASALDEAEAVLGRLAGYPALGRDPCLRAAQALFERATGSSAETAFADAERLCRERRSRVPYRLRTLRTESQMARAGDADPGGAPRWSSRARVSLAWNRQYAVVLQDVLTASFPLEQRDPQAAMMLAARIALLVDDLGKESARSDLTVQEATSLLLVKAAAQERSGELRAAQQRFREASASYAFAVANYREARYRPRAGLAAVRAAVLALRAGVTQGTNEESDLLTALLTGLQEIEYDRGRLRDGKYRSSLLKARDATYSEVFAALAEHVTANRDKAAEIALWLLESVHRNALAENIRASQGTGTTGAAEEALRRLREPADVAGIRQVVTGRAALYYRCERAGREWQVTTVLVAPSGITLHRAVLPLPEPGTGRVTAMRKLPAALLDELASGVPERVSFVHTNVRLGATVWTELAQALLPPELAGALRSLESREGPAILLIIPDGPLSSVPFAGLRLDNGSAVADHAAVVFMPNLLAFSANEWTGEPDDGECVAVAHFGPTLFKDAFEQQRDKSVPGLARMTVRAAPDRESFVSALAQVPAPRIAVISHHGETAADPADRFVHFEGGGQLSERDAERIRWPEIVVLGSCWASDITVRAGDDPVGLPTACLLGGARAVLGGQSRVDNDETSAWILARVTLDAALGQHPALTLQSAVSDHLAAHPADRNAPPAQWANMTVWTGQAPAGLVPAAPRWPSWTTQLTARSPGEDRFAAFDITVLTKNPQDRRNTRTFSVPIGQALQRVLEHASRTGPADRVTTLDLLTAIFATEDNPDWVSFAVGASIPAMPVPDSARDASQEADDTSSMLRLGRDLQVPVTAVLLSALRWGERLAVHLHDPAITPAHMVYGFLCEGTCDAARLIAKGGHTIPELLVLLSDRVFSIDLPAPEELPPLKERPRSCDLVRPLVRKRQNPRTSRELFDLITAASGNGRKVLSTLAFAGSAAAADSTAWRALTDGGFRLNPPVEAPLREHGHGGQAISLGDGYVATVTREFAEAFKGARALAYHLGDPEVLPQHVLYGILAEQDSDAARWLQAAASPSPAQPPGGVEAAGQSAVEVLSQRVFRSPLPAVYRLPAAPQPPAKTPDWLPLLIPFMLSALLLQKIGRKARGWLVFSVLLAILIVTMGLADINSAAENSAQLTAEQPVLTGTITLSRQANDAPVPATLIGGLSRFYAPPAVTGWRNIIPGLFSGWGNPPGSLSGWYLFALPAPAHAPAATAASLIYRGARYPAQVTCQGQIDYALCFAAVKLPGGVGPGGFWWGSESYSNVPAGTEMSQTAVVYQGTSQSPTVGLADIAIYQETSSGDDVIEVKDQAGRPIRPDSPVVLNDRSRVMPFFGVAIPARSGPWDAVYPPNLLDLYGQGIADKIAGPLPGSQAYAGVELTGSSADELPAPALVTFVVPGSPADDAGIEANDEIVAIGAKTVDGPVGVTNILSSHHAGQTVTFEILRKQGNAYVRHTIKVTLGYRPS